MDRAIELKVGRTTLSYGEDWYDRRFDQWYRNQRYYYKDIDYLGYKRSTPIGVQFHYQIYKTLGNNPSSGFEWYYGGGAQMRFQGYRYDYRYKLEGRGNEWFYETGRCVVNLDVGGDVQIGIEYTFQDAPPFSFFRC